MSIRATNASDHFVGSITLAKTPNDDGSFNAFKTSSANDGLVPIGRIRKDDHGQWVAVAASGGVATYKTRTRAAGYLITQARRAEREARITAAAEATRKAAAETLEEHATGPEADNARLFQRIDAMGGFAVDAGFCPEGREVLVLGTDKFIRRVRLTGHVHWSMSDSSTPHTYSVVDHRGHTGSVTWALIIPTSILDEEKAAADAAKMGEVSAAITRVERFMAEWNRPLVAGFGTSIDGQATMLEVTAEDLRAIIAAARGQQA